MSGFAGAAALASATRVRIGEGAACHGADGNTTQSPDIPKLAGQKADYLVRALQGYKNGARKNPIMAPMGAYLSQRDMEDLAAYFSQQSGLKTSK